MVNFSLEGKVALVTGASYGIGFAIATGFAQAGAKIVFNDIKQELVDKGLAAYKELGIDARGYVCDVTNEEAVNALVAQIEKEVGVIDILVNNAGIIKRIPMCEMSAAEFRQVIDVDLNAPFIVSKAVIPSMIKKGHGKIINICSMMSELGRETVSAYAAAKGGLKMLTRNIASNFTVVGYYGAFPLFVIARELDLVGNVAPVAVVEEFTRFGFALQVAVDVFDEQVPVEFRPAVEELLGHIHRITGKPFLPFCAWAGFHNTSWGG